ncbi:Bud-site selection protein [Mycena floridula]|nr:Bud-site selection protein [Mycena floridula]
MKVEYRGTKRKRYEPKEHHELKEVKKASKKSKTFETQKLVKKLKNLRLKKAIPTEINDCETQLEELKGISHDAVATTALRSKLTKDKVLAENEHIQSALAQELDSNLLVSADPGSAAARVQARLLSSKLMAMSISAVVDDLRTFLSPPVDDEDMEAEEEVRPTKVKKVARPADDEDVEMDLGEEEFLMDDEEEDDGEEDDSGTIGDDEREDDGWESGSVAAHDSVAMSDADDDDDDVPMVASTSKLTKPTATKAKATVTASTFLPSLAVGFTRGSSDSDWSDAEADLVDSAPKKNRRGQRARQAIWEKKFTEMNERGRKRWPEPKGNPRATNGERRDRRNKPAESQQHQQPDSGWSNNRSNNPPAAKPREPPPRAAAPQQEERPLHPSWEAKKKLKERQNAAIVPIPAGRRIVF